VAARDQEGGPADGRLAAGGGAQRPAAAVVRPRSPEVEEFRRRYFAELEAHPEAWRPLLEAARVGNITLLFSARDTSHNNAVALREFLEEKLKEPKDPSLQASGL